MNFNSFNIFAQQIITETDLRCFENFNSYIGWIAIPKPSNNDRTMNTMLTLFVV